MSDCQVCFRETATSNCLRCHCPVCPACTLSAAVCKWCHADRVWLQRQPPQQLKQPSWTFLLCAGEQEIPPVLQEETSQARLSLSQMQDQARLAQQLERLLGERQPIYLEVEQATGVEVGQLSTLRVGQKLAAEGLGPCPSEFLLLASHLLHFCSEGNILVLGRLLLPLSSKITEAVFQQLLQKLHKRGGFSDKELEGAESFFKEKLGALIAGTFVSVLEPRRLHEFLGELLEEKGRAAKLLHKEMVWLCSLLPRSLDLAEWRRKVRVAYRRRLRAGSSSSFMEENEFYEQMFQRLQMLSVLLPGLDPAEQQAQQEARESKIKELQKRVKMLEAQPREEGISPSSSSPESDQALVLAALVRNEEKLVALLDEKDTLQHNTENYILESLEQSDSLEQVISRLALLGNFGERLARVLGRWQGRFGQEATEELSGGTDAGKSKERRCEVF